MAGPSGREVVPTDDPGQDLALAEVGASHAPVLAALQAACFDSPWGEQAFSDLLTLPGHRAWLVTRAQVPLGYALFQLVAGEGELLSIAVTPEARGQGVGDWLLAQTLHYCNASGIKRMILDVSAENAAARALYDKYGFRQVGLRKNYYHSSDGRKFDALVLSREEIRKNDL